MRALARIAIAMLTFMVVLIGAGVGMASFMFGTATIGSESAVWILLGLAGLLAMVAGGLGLALFGRGSIAAMFSTLLAGTLLVAPGLLILLGFAHALHRANF